MKKLTKQILLLSFICSININSQIRLIVRADDMGMSPSTDTAIIDCYQNGYVTVTELMVPCPWFNHAARLLNENPRLDVGIHLVLNSEWTYYRWRPLTSGKTIRDADGYFYPLVWGDSLKSLQKAIVDTSEVEAELRAQIETALKNIPHISHVTQHMSFGSLDQYTGTRYNSIVKGLAKEYSLKYESYSEDEKVKGIRFENTGTFQQRKESLIKAIRSTTQGDYMLVEHPAINDFDTRGMDGTVAIDRHAVYLLFKDPEIKALILEKKIELITYKDLK